MQQPLVGNQQLQPSSCLQGDLEGHLVQCRILGENKGSGRKGGTLRDLTYNLSFSHGGSNYIYPINNNKTCYTCSTNNRKLRGDYGHFHKKLLIKALYTLEMNVQIWENKVFFCTSVFFKDNSKASFSILTNNVCSPEEEELKYSCHYFVFGNYSYCMW